MQVEPCKRKLKKIVRSFLVHSPLYEALPIHEVKVLFSRLGGVPIIFMTFYYVIRTFFVAKIQKILTFIMISMPGSWASRWRGSRIIIWK